VGLATGAVEVELADPVGLPPETDEVATRAMGVRYQESSVSPKHSPMVTPR
jgi:hypothetical protein